MAVAGGHSEEEGRLAHTDHHQWMVLRATALHPAECHPIAEDGDEAEAVVVGAEDGEDVRGRTADPEAARHGGAFLTLLTAGHHPEPRQDEATAGGTARHEEPVLAVGALEAEEGEVLATVPTAATAVGVGTADD